MQPCLNVFFVFVPSGWRMYDLSQSSGLLCVTHQMLLDWLVFVLSNIIVGWHSFKLSMHWGVTKCTKGLSSHRLVSPSCRNVDHLFLLHSSAAKWSPIPMTLGGDWWEQKTEALIPTNSGWWHQQLHRSLKRSSRVDNQEDNEEQVRQHCLDTVLIKREPVHFFRDQRPMAPWTSIIA